VSERAGAAVTCVKCGQANAAEDRSCGACGALVRIRCASCGTDLPEAARFCMSCGAPRHREPARPQPYSPPHLERDVLRSKIALEGERKLVTVLFVDVKDSVELSARAGAEEWHAVMDAFFGMAARAVHGVEGTINQYTGDGIMALFGAPIAHEDHAQRACLAALQLRDEVAAWNAQRVQLGLPTLPVRLGMNSGEVIVGKIGDDLRMDYTARGQIVGLAARMEQLAEPGAVYLTQDTARLVEGYFALRELGPLHVRGADQAIRCFALEGIGRLQSRLERARRAGLSPFVNRDEELRTLRAALADVRRGRGVSIGIAGEPGLGKSRICAELLEECSADFEVHHAQCSRQRQVVGLSPVRQVLRSFLGLAEGESPAECRAKVRARLAGLDAGLESAVAPTLEALGVGAKGTESIDPEARRRQLLRVLQRMARRPEVPTVIAIDDAQWLDPESGACFAQLAATLEGSHLLLLLNFRSSERPDWLRAGDGEICLAPLHDHASQALLARLLGGDASLAPLYEVIGQRAAGNPFFIEEMVRCLRELGALEGEPGAYRLVREIPELKVPDTVQSLIASRIDRLAEDDKQLLSIAAVIGKRFNSELLARVASFEGDIHAPLARLCHAGFLHEDDPAPNRAPRYSFAHPLTHEVAYTARLSRSRADTHARVAEILREGPPEEVNRNAPTIAQHFEAAGRMLDAARHMLRAAQWTHRSDHQESYRHLQSLRRIAQLCPASTERDDLLGVACLMLLGNGWRHGLRLEPAGELFAQGIELARKQRRRTWEAGFHASHGRILASEDCADAYVAKVEQALAIARGEDEDTQLGLQAMLSQALRRAGRLQEGLALGDAVIAQLGGPERRLAGMDFSPHVWLRTLRAQTRIWMGSLDAARAEIRTLLEVDERHVSVDLHAARAHVIAEISWARQDQEGLLAIAQRAHEIAEARGSGYSIVASLHALGVAQLLRARWTEAEQALGAALAIMQRDGAGEELMAQGLALRAEARLRLGDPHGGLDIARASLDAAERRGMRYYVGVAGLCCARLLLRQSTPQVDEAERALARVEQVGREIGARIYRPYVEAERAEIARRRGDAAEHEGRLAAALALFAEIGSPRGQGGRPRG
jgi:class 3 adenylate cyclase